MHKAGDGSVCSSSNSHISDTASFLAPVFFTGTSLIFLLSSRAVVPLRINLIFHIRPPKATQGHMWLKMGIAHIEHALMALYLPSEWNSCAGSGQMLIESSILFSQWPTRWPLACGHNHAPWLILLRHLILEISYIITKPNVCRKFLSEKIAQILFWFCSCRSKKTKSFHLKD